MIAFTIHGGGSEYKGEEDKNVAVKDVNEIKIMPHIPEHKRFAPEHVRYTRSWSGISNKSYSAGDS